MSNFFETRSYWHGGFTEDQQEYYKEYCLSQKGIHLWRLIHQSYEYAKNLYSIYNISFCRDESCCFMRHKNLAFQCEYNEDESLASYAKRNYFMMQNKQKNLLLLRVPMKLLLFLKILMMPLRNSKVLIYLIIALRILIKNIILLTISKGSLHERKRD